MFLSALFFLSGVVLVQQWAQLPSLTSFLLIVLPVALVLTVLYTVVRFSYHRLQYCLKALLLAVAGMSWAVFFAHQALQHRLPEALAGKTIRVEGQIIGIPVNEKRVERFYLSVQHFEPVIVTKGVPERLRLSAATQLKYAKYTPRKIRLSWYYSKKFKVAAVHAGEIWQFVVRLKPPHGFFNPGGFDYEGWLFQRGIDASGYVRRPVAESGWYNQRLSAAAVTSIDAYRQKISQSIGQWLAADHAISFYHTPTSTAMTGLVTALAVGERVKIQPGQWQDLLHTGTNHLMAISGLHIGLAYLFGYIFGRWLVAMLVPLRCLQHLPAQHIGIILGVMIAIFYALLAGLSIPTQRALIMLLSFAAAALLRRHFRPVDALGLAMILVLIWDPLSVLSAGFWFSFIAVTVILYAFTDNFSLLQADVATARNDVWLNHLGLGQSGQNIARKIAQCIRLQFIITLALFPLSLYLFQQSSLLAPLANLILVPYVSFLVVPFVLLGLLLFPFFPLLSELSIQVAAELLHWIWPFIHLLSNLPFAYITVGNITLWPLISAFAAIIMALIPRRCFTFIGTLIGPENSISKIPGRHLTGLRSVLSFLLFIPLLSIFFARNASTSITTGSFKPGSFKLMVLDVGQGLASVIQTRHHTLVFDAGAKLGKKLDAGKAVVLPYLRTQGIRMLDTLVISHGDADHIGGAASILAAYPAARLIGQDLHRLHSVSKVACQQRQHWRWDGVNFRFLNPPAKVLAAHTPTARGTAVRNRRKKKSRGKRRNNHSCVLRISSAAGSVLFTGDIEIATEKRLLKAALSTASGIILSADVLVVPHHGSKTSSSVAFIDAVHPKIAIISAGYRNRYRLPSKKILSRYQHRNISLWITGHAGAVSMEFVPGRGLIKLDAYRRSHHHYWNRVL